MNNSKKLTALLSSAAMATLIASAISTPVSAKMASVVLKDSSGKLYEYNYQQLKESFTNGTALWDDFTTLKNSGATVLSYYDDVQNSYVSRDTLIDAFINNPPGEIFNAQTKTETLNTTPITDPIYEKILNEDGTVSEQPKEENLEVSSVSAINATTVNVQLPAGVDATKAADKTQYTVKVGTEDVAVTAVNYSSVAKIATLTVNMADKEGTLTVNGVAAADVVDYKKPTATVQAVDSTHIKVTFSEAVDKTDAENILNYTLSDPSGVVLLSATPLTVDSSASLSADGKDLTITLGNTDVPGGLVAGTFYLTINDGSQTATDQIKDIAGNIVDKAIIGFQGVATADTEGPSLVSGSYNNATGALKLNFSEAISLTDSNVVEAKITIKGADGNSYVLKETDYAGAASSASNITITLPTASKTAVNALTSPLTIEASEGAFKDIAGNNSVVSSKELSLTTAPVLQSATYNEETNKLVLKFNEPVKYDTLTDLTNIQVKINNGAYAGLSASSTIDTTADGTEIEVTPNSPAFRTTSTVTSASVKLKAGAITDVADEQTNLENTATLTYTDDATKPVLQSATYSTLSKIVTLTFSEDVDVTTLSLGNFKVYDADTAEDVLDDATGGSSGTTAKLTVTDSNVVQIQLNTVDAAAVAALDKGTLKVSLSGVEDITGNVMTAITKAASTGIDLTTNDLTPPTVGTISAVDANTVTVAFDEKVTAATANVVGNYNIYATNSPSTKLTVSNAVLQADGKTVTLTTSAQENGVEYTVKVTGVKDLAGNLVENGPDNEGTFTGTVAANIAPTVVSATYEDTNKDGTVNSGDLVKVTFTEPVKLSGTVDGNDFNLTVSPTPSLGTGAVASISTEDPTVVEIALGANPNLTVVGTNTMIDVKAINDITDLAGKKAVASSPVEIQGDETAPSIESATFTDVDGSNTFNAGDKLTVVYNEDLDISTDDLVDNTGKIDSFSVGNLGDFGSATIQVVDSKTIEITFADDTNFGTFAVGDDVAYVTASNSVNDIYGNESDTTPIATVGANEVGPKITKAELVDVDGNGVDAGDKLTVTFDQGVQLGSATAAELDDDFTLNTGSDLDLDTSGAYFVKDNNQIVLTLGTNAKIAANPTINIKTDGTQNIADIYGNSAEAVSSPVTITVATDTVAPTLNSVTWTDTDENGSVSATDKLVFTFSEAMDKGTLPSGATMDTLLGANDGDFGDAATGSWNAAGTEFTVTLSGTGIAVADGDTFNPTTAVKDIADNADATVFSPSVTIADDSIAPSDVVADNIIITNVDTATDLTAGSDDTIVLTADGNASNTKWADSGLQDGDKIVFTVGGEVLTYTLQDGDIANLIGSTDVTLVIDNDDTLVGGVFSGTIGDFDGAITDGETVNVVLKDVAGNESTGIDITVDAD